MSLRWSDVASTLFGSVMRVHTTLTVLIILPFIPALISEGLWPTTLVVNWAGFATGLLAWLIRRRLFVGKKGAWYTLLGSVGGFVVLLALISLLGFATGQLVHRTTFWDPLDGPVLFAPILSYGLHALQERWKGCRWLTPLALIFPLCIMG